MLLLFPKETSFMYHTVSKPTQFLFCFIATRCLRKDRKDRQQLCFFFFFFPLFPIQHIPWDKISKELWTSIAQIRIWCTDGVFIPASPVISFLRRKRKNSQAMTSYCKSDSTDHTASRDKRDLLLYFY